MGETIKGMVAAQGKLYVRGEQGLYTFKDNGREPNEWDRAHFSAAPADRPFADFFFDEIHDLVNGSTIVNEDRQELCDAIMDMVTEGLPNDPKANVEACANDAPASTIYCPYADRDIPISESSPEHIIPLALGGMNGFTIPVSKDFNSSVGSEIDGALANDFLVMSKRDKHGAKGHSKKHPENVFSNASNAETGETLHVTLGQVRGLRLWDPKQKRDVTGQGQKVNIGFKVDLDVTHRFVAKVALSAGYLVYGDHFRKHVKHEDFRKIMNQKPTEMGDLLKTIEAQYDDRFLEPKTDNQIILRAMMTGFGPHSVIALIPNSRSLSVVVGVLGDYIGMLSVPADTKTFPNTGEYRQGHFFVLMKPIAIRDSIWNLREQMLKRAEDILAKRT